MKREKKKDPRVHAYQNDGKREKKTQGAEREKSRAFPLSNLSQRGQKDVFETLLNASESANSDQISLANHPPQKKPKKLTKKTEESKKTGDRKETEEFSQKKKDPPKKKRSKQKGFIKEVTAGEKRERQGGEGTKRSLRFLYNLDDEGGLEVLKTLNPEERVLLLKALEKEISQGSADALRIQALWSQLKEWREKKEREPIPVDNSALLEQMLPPFHAFSELPIVQQIAILESESPRVVAILFAHLTPQQSAKLLNRLKDDQKKAVVRCLKKPFRIDREILQRIEEELNKKIEARGEDDFSTEIKGESILVEILKHLPLQEEQKLLTDLSEDDPLLGDRLHQKTLSLDVLYDLSTRSLAPFLLRVDEETLLYLLHEGEEKMVETLRRGLSATRFRDLQHALFLQDVNFKEKDRIIRRFMGALKEAVLAGDLGVDDDEMIE